MTSPFNSWGMKIGDKIRFLDDVGGGTVKGFARGGYAVIEDNDGFEIPYPINKCVVVEEYVAPAKLSEEERIRQNRQRKEMEAKEAEEKRKRMEREERSRFEQELRPALKEKYSQEGLSGSGKSCAKAKIRIKAMRSEDDEALVRETAFGVLEVDLHANQLLLTTKGMGNTDILLYQLSKFNEVMLQYRRKKGTQIVFIHGKGEGVLRNALLHELRTKYPQCYWQDAPFHKYGYGATKVTIR